MYSQNENLYSQNLEEKVIVDYFKDFKGTFLDIGANDGVTLSNTRRLAELGWKGICLDPSPNAFARLKNNYASFSNVYVYPYGIGKHNGLVSLMESGTLLGNGDIGLVSTINKAETKRWDSLHVKFMDVETQLYRWKTFKNRIKFKQFDFISIDTEGNDMEVLSQIVEDKTLNPKMICIEWNGVEEVRRDASILLPDFKIVYTSAENLIFAK